MASKLHLVQELSENDFDRRVQFCDLIMKMMIIYSLIIMFFLLRLHLSWLEI